eukprot:UN25153
MGPAREMYFALRGMSFLPFLWGFLGNELSRESLERLALAFQLRRVLFKYYGHLDFNDSK